MVWSPIWGSGRSIGKPSGQPIRQRWTPGIRRGPREMTRVAADDGNPQTAGLGDFETNPGWHSEPLVPVPQLPGRAQVLGNTCMKYFRARPVLAFYATEEWKTGETFSGNQTPSDLLSAKPEYLPQSYSKSSLHYWSCQKRRNAIGVCPLREARIRRLTCWRLDGPGIGVWWTAGPVHLEPD